MTLEGRGLDLYSRQGEPPQLNPPYNSMQKERLQPPPFGTFYTPPRTTSTQLKLGTDLREKQREGNRDHGRGKERGRGRNWDYGDYYDNNSVDGKWYGENNVARATNLRPKAPSRRSSSQPSYQSDNRKGYGDNTVSRHKTLSRPQCLARRSSSQPSQLNDNGKYDDRNAQSTAINRRKSRPQVVTRRSSSQPSRRRNSGGNREMQIESTALNCTRTRPQGITRRSSSQPSWGSDPGENSKSRQANTTMSRTMTRPQGMIRRSSSQVSQQGKRGEDYDGQIPSTELSRTSTRPQVIAKQNSPQQSQQGNRGDNRARLAENTVSRRGNTRPNMTRRSSSHPGHGRRTNTVTRRENYNSDSDSEGILQERVTKIEKQGSGSSQEKSRDRFSKTPTGLGAGVVGAMVGGWAAKKAYKSSNIGRQRRASSGDNGSGSGTGGALMTLVGATVAGVAFNTVIDRLEEKNMVKKVGKGEVVTLVKYTGRAANAVIDHLAEERARNLRESEGRRGGPMGYGGRSREYGGIEYESRDHGGRDRGNHMY